jgi:putative sporulation protein YyaC
MINQKHDNAFIIAIDASLGTSDHIGYITLGEGPLKPGAGVDKELPEVGDLFITGIVNFSGMLDHMLLQTTRLNVVMSMADQICLAISYCINQIKSHLLNEVY